MDQNALTVYLLMYDAMIKQSLSLTGLDKSNLPMPQNKKERNGDTIYHQRVATLNYIIMNLKLKLKLHMFSSLTGYTLEVLLCFVQGVTDK